MKDNSLRLRLTQTEVDRFRSEGKVSSTTRIGAMPEHPLTYTLVKVPGGGEVKALFEANEIRGSVPGKMAAGLVFTNRLRLEEHMPLETGEHLFYFSGKRFQMFAGKAVRR